MGRSRPVDRGLDNVTHSLAGMILAEAVCVSRRQSRAEFRSAAYLASALANNLPDIDFVYTWVTGPKPLGNLLHHRGHTHTFVGALPLGLLLGWAVLGWFTRRGSVFSKLDRGWVLGLALAGALLHIAMDYGNNYGVHPFWPLSGKWFYGDTIFIVEPLWWAVSIPVVALAVTRRWLRVTLLTLLLAVLALSAFLPFVSRASLVVLWLASSVSLAVALFATPRGRAGFAVLGFVAVAAVFMVSSARAEAALRAGVTSAFPALRVHDIAKTPMPANPVCYSALVVGDQGSSYRVLSVVVSILPKLVPVERCPFDTDAAPTAPMSPIERADRADLRWLQQYRAELADLHALRARDCRFRALLKFARVPYVTSPASGESSDGTPQSTVAGDLRYDRSPGLDFSDMSLPAAELGNCPRFVPGWQEPRLELFAR